MTPPIGRRAFERPALEVAPDLLGSIVFCAGADGQVAVRLTEVEAYAGEGEDPGSHAHRGRTPRNTVMFGPPGHLYVYFTYGMHWCANLVCSPDGVASAVLLRAGEIIEGNELAWARRSTARHDVDLARGPARLAQALGLTGAASGLDVCDGGPVSVLDGVREGGRVRRGPRTGVGGDGAQRLWRFWLDGEPTVSPYRPHLPRRGNRMAAAVRRTEESPA